MYNNLNSYNPYSHPVPPADPNKGIGFGSFVLFAVTTGIIALMFLLTKTLIPCSIPGGGEEYGWYGCNNSEGNGFMFLFALTFAAYVFLVLPVVAILALIGTVKNAGRKWAVWTLIAIGVGVMIAPVVYVLMSGAGSP